ncbi:MAG: ABC transporter permease, partial [Caulobacteraceae bacterium]|nr:ABC transporter permease [Caulobacter sp.]
EPWFGKGGVPDDLPIPQLVAVDLDRRAPPTTASLERVLADAGVDGDVDDGRRWSGDVQRAAQGMALGAVAAALVVAAAAAAVAAYATRAGLAARREVVEVLHLTGARDDYVAGLFQRRFGVLALWGGALGAAGAAALLALARSAGGGDGFSPVLPLAWSDLLIVLPCPPAAAAVAALAARRTAEGILRAAP